MPKIKTLYFINHSHTDIGFTDYQSVCLRQHMEHIDDAIRLCEMTEDYPKEAQTKWVCEVTGITERYLRSRPARQVDKFLKYYKEGRLDVTGMQYNLTPLLNVEEMVRSLYPIKRLKDDFGIEIKTAMNCDVDGASWLFADLLPELGIELFTMAINPVRGRTPKPRPAAFWWKGPSGKKLLVWNGYHYLFGSFACLGNMALAEKNLPDMVRKLEDDPDYPFDFIYGQTTNPIRVDNNPPDKRLPDFIKEWNKRGLTPRMELITVTEFNRILRERYLSPIPEVSGDWTDWWCDGAASSAYETGLNRSTHEILHSAEFIASLHKALGGLGFDSTRAAQIYDNAILYDEHTWGSFGSIETPNSIFSKANWSSKSHRAYFASAEAHDVLAREAKGFALTLAKKDKEAYFDLGNLPEEIARPAAEYKELLVINTLPFERKVIVEEPVRRAGQAPAGMLEMFVPRGITWGIKYDLEGRRVEGIVPESGYAFLPLEQEPKGMDLKGEGRTIENAFFRITVNNNTGGLEEWFDKELQHDFAGVYKDYQIGQYIYERVDSPRGRDAIFESDWFNEDFGNRPTDTPFVRSTATKVKVSSPVITSHSAKIQVEIEVDGVRSAVCEFVLPSGQKTLEVNWFLDKKDTTEPEAVFFAFPFNLNASDFIGDINGIPIIPEAEQLNGAVRDWYPIQRWIDISDDNKGVTVVPIDAPLVHLGGITTGKWAEKLVPESPAVMSWAMNNHWMVNFKDSQGGAVSFRYRLTTHSGKADRAACTKYGAEAVTEPIVLRDFIRNENTPQSGSFVKLSPANKILLTFKPAENGDGIIIRLQNPSLEHQKVKVEFPLIHPKQAYLASPLEENTNRLEIENGALKLELPARSLNTIRVLFN